MKTYHNHDSGIFQKDDKIAFWPAFSMTCLVCCISISCTSSDEQPQTYSYQKSSARRTGLAQEGQEDPWIRNCSRCHDKMELKGVPVEAMKVAIRDVPRMKRLSFGISEQALESIEKTLAVGSEELYPYHSYKECQRCHSQQVEEWNQSLHSKAHKEEVYDYYFIKASLETNQKIETFCASCHTPLGVYNGNIPFKSPVRKRGDTKVSQVESEGVQCEFCHSIKGYKEVKNGGYLLSSVRVMHGPFENSESQYHGTEFSKLIKSSEYCGICHDVTHPSNGIVLEATYTEWKNSPYAQAGITCIDCHMTEGLVEKSQKPGRAAKTGPARNHISTHFFIGPNILFSGGPEAEPLRNLSLALLKKSGRVTIGEPEIKGQKLLVPIDITNVGAGHYLPTGITELRELWLEVFVTDKAGKNLFKTPGLDWRGILHPQAIVYKTHVLDKAGKRTTRFWNTVKKESDYRIPPQKTITETIEIPIERVNKSEILKITSFLKYRSLSPAGLAEVDAPPELIKIPSITVSEAERVYLQ